MGGGGHTVCMVRCLQESFLCIYVSIHFEKSCKVLKQRSTRVPYADSSRAIQQEAHVAAVQYLL